MTPNLVMLKWECSQNMVKKYIKREIFDRVADHLEKPEITLITGSRQVGKTVLLSQLKEFLIKQKNTPKESFFSYNLDLIQDWEIFQDQTDFIEFLKDRSRKQKIYVFIDEAQRTPEAARFFKGVYDANLNVKLILTGSSSLELKAEFKESLTGRKRIFKLSPFSFLEFLSCRDKFLTESLKKNRKLSKIDEKKILNYYLEYMIYGGYPQAVLAETQEDKISALKEIYSSYIERDVVGFLEIKNKSAFSRLLKLLAAQIGQLVNIGELAGNLGIDRKTVEKYIFSLEETFILKKINPYYTNSRQEIVKSGKIYFNDLGIRNLALGNFAKLDKRIDNGALFENAVFIELYPFLSLPSKLYFWRTKQGSEVDFIIEEKNLIPAESKLSVKGENIPLGMKNFIKKFKPEKAIMVNLSIDGESVRTLGAKIEFVYPFKIKTLLS